MQGVDPAEMLFGREEDHRMPSNLEEEIVTAEDYLDDNEEETAQPINKKRLEKPPGQESEYTEDMNESAIE